MDSILTYNWYRKTQWIGQMSTADDSPKIVWTRVEFLVEVPFSTYMAPQNLYLSLLMI